MLYNNRTWNKVLEKTMNTGKWKVIEATIEQELYGTDELQVRIVKDGMYPYCSFDDIKKDVEAKLNPPEEFWPKENPHIYISSARACGKSMSQLEIYKELFNSMYGSRKAIYKPYIDPMEIKDVIFNDPATIVFWADGTKTVVKCQEGDEFDPEKGLTMAIAKKVYGNKGSYCNAIKKWTEPYHEKQQEKNDLVAKICDLGKKASAALAALTIAETAIVNAKKREEKHYTLVTDNTFNYDEVIFDTRGDAEKCLDILKDLIETYGCATVADMYEASGIEDVVHYMMNRYGWTSLKDSKIYRSRHGYIIDLPKATLIGSEESDSK